jgi:PAS domain S-box-containing protein
LVKTHYLVRTGAFLACLLTIGIHLWENGYGALAWTLLALQFAVYPHLVYLRAKHSAHPVQAELDNLLLDSLLLGVWCGLLGFPLWITYAMTSASMLNAMVNRAARGALVSIACTVAGAALGVALDGFDYRPETSDLVTGLCFFGALAYAGAVGRIVYTQNRRLVHARDELRASEGRYRLIAENAADLIALVDQHGRWHYASPSYSRMLDVRDLEPGTDAYRRMHPDDADTLRTAVLRASATGKPRELALRLVDRDGRMRQLKTRLQPVDGKVVLVSQDVTELRESEEKLLLAAHALEGMTEAIMITAADGTVLTVNRAFCQITGYAREEVLGQSERSVRSGLQPADFYDELYAAVAREGYWSGTTWSRRKNGSVYREWRSVRAVRDEAGKVTHYVMVFYEVGASGPPIESSLRA